MIKATLMCLNGMSTAVMEKKMMQSAVERNIEFTIKAIAQNQFRDPEDADIIILGPQLKYAESDVRKLLDSKENGKQIPLYVIEPSDFGMMRGDVVLTKILKVLGRDS